VINPPSNEIKRDEKGDIVYQYFSETVIVNCNSVYIYPDDFSLSVKTEMDIRHRGIFTVPIYSAAIEMGFDFNPFGALDTLTKRETLHWDRSEVRVYPSRNRALRGAAQLRSQTASFKIEILVLKGEKSAGLKPDLVTRGMAHRSR